MENEFETFQGREGDRNVELCLRTVEKFVMKPQREGGGMFQAFNLSTQY